MDREEVLGQKVDALASGVTVLADDVSALSESVDIERKWRRRNFLAFCVLIVVFSVFAATMAWSVHKLIDINEFNKECNDETSECFRARTSAFVQTVEEEVGDRIAEAARDLIIGFENAGCVDINEDGVIGEGGFDCVPLP